jgi:hypothetical protein
VEARIGTRKFNLDDFQGVSAQGAGELIRHEPVEHAVIYSAAGKALYYVRSRPGEPYRVTIPFGRAGLLRGNVFVHNHPGNESFSAHDIWILLRHGAREVHVYGPERAFRMVTSTRMRRFGRAEELTGWAEVRLSYKRAMQASAMRFERFIRARMFTEGQALAAQTHSVVRKLALQFHFSYQEIER